jgi:hypothetical protein
MSVIELPQEDPVMARLTALETKVASLESAVADMAQKALTATAESGTQHADVVESGPLDENVPVVIDNVAEVAPVVHASVNVAAPSDSV